MNDTISRQQTIAALRALSDEDGYINAPHEVVTDVVRGLPPAQAKQGQTVHSERGKTDKLGVKTGETYKDTISRQAAIDIIEDFPHGGVWNVESMEEMVYRIKQLSSAQPERKTGKWYKPVGMMPPEYAGVYRCSKCDEVAMRDWKHHKQVLSNFCPNCGADMREGQDG